MPAVHRFYVNLHLACSHRVGLSLEGSPKLAPAVARFLRRDRTDAEKRIKALLNTGRCDKPTCDAMLGELKAVRLSLDAAGESTAYTVNGKTAVPNDLLSRLKWHESLPAGVYFRCRGQ